MDVATRCLVDALPRHKAGRVRFHAVISPGGPGANSVARQPGRNSSPNRAPGFQFQNRNEDIDRLVHLFNLSNIFNVVCVQLYRCKCVSRVTNL
jgi:hypothetical protein